MTQRLAEWFAAYEAHIEAEALTSNVAKPEFVFMIAPSKRTKDALPRLLSEPWARSRFYEFLRRAGIERHALYDLRHTYATELLAVARREQGRP